MGWISSFVPKLFKKNIPQFINTVRSRKVKKCRKDASIAEIHYDPLIAHSEFPLYLESAYMCLLLQEHCTLNSGQRPTSLTAYMSAPRTAGWGQNKEFCRALT